jgi:hypothetical protein
MLGATGRLAARALFAEVPDRENPHHASRVPQASFKLLLPGIDLHGSGATGQLAAAASRRGPRRMLCVGISLGRTRRFGNAGPSHRSPAE